ncbi:MAG TPA: hypothetical protein VN706_16635 [Gemmatimonadaceae bacterium]|nr:hypothetical protein [Gemmatimonadaceae bacterium]
MRKLLTLALAAAPVGAQAPAVRLIAAPDASSAPLFGVAAAVRALPGGRVLVNDVARRQLTLLDPTLRSPTVIADSVSGTASSYGTRAGGLIAYTGDSTLFVDPAGLSMFVIDPAGTIARVASVPRSQDAGAIAGSGVLALDGKGRLVYRGGMNIMRMSAPRGGNTGSGLPFMPDFPDSSAIVRVDLATRKLDTAAYFKIAKVKLNITRTESGIGSMSQVIDPLPVIDDWAVLADGSIAIVRGHDYHVDFVHADGTVSAGTKIPFDWQRLSDDDKIAVIDSARKAAEAQAAAAPKDGNTAANTLAGAVGGATQQRVVMNFSTGGGGAPAGAKVAGAAGGGTTEYVNASDLPDYRPAFTASAVRGDEDGNVWVRTTAVRGGAAGAIYDVINSRGELVDRIQIPAGRQIVGFGKSGVVYMAAHDASGTWIERTHR